jgi:hypothetical protein
VVCHDVQESQCSHFVNSLADRRAIPELFARKSLRFVLRCAQAELFLFKHRDMVLHFAREIGVWREPGSNSLQHGS